MTNSDKTYMWGVWPNAAAFSAGEAPYMLGDATWPDVMSAVCAEDSIMATRTSVLLARRTDGEWVPSQFLSAPTKRNRFVNEVQRQKYLNKRRASNPIDDPEPSRILEDPAVPEVPQASTEPEPEGDLVLRVTPHIAELFRDAFTLVAAGRSVTIHTVAQPQQ